MSVKDNEYMRQDVYPIDILSTAARGKVDEA
jgi:hypothetical protein